MDLTEYVSFQEELGRRVTWIDQVPFSNYRSLFYWSLPRTVQYEPDVNRVRRLLFTRALGVIYPNENGNRSISFCVCRNPDYAFKTLQARTRTKTRRGLEHCRIQRLDWEQMRTEGLAINRAALQRQQRRSGRLDNARWWDRQCRISSRHPDIQAWGVSVNGELTGYVHVILFDQTSNDAPPKRYASISHFMTDSRHLKSYPNEALIFRVTQALLHDFKCDHVVLGSSSNDPHLLSWKRHMGYTQWQVPYTIMVNPVLQVVKHLVPKLRHYLS